MLEFMTTLQVVLVPEHAPDQPENTCPESGLALRVTVSPELKLPEVCEHVDMQLIFPSALVIPPFPDLETERVYLVTGGVVVDGGGKDGALGVVVVGEE